MQERIRKVVWIIVKIGSITLVIWFFYLFPIGLGGVRSLHVKNDDTVKLGFGFGIVAYRVVVVNVTSESPPNLKLIEESEERVEWKVPLEKEGQGRFGTSFITKELLVRHGFKGSTITVNGDNFDDGNVIKIIRFEGSILKRVANAIFHRDLILSDEGKS